MTPQYDQSADSTSMPLAAFVTLSARKNAFNVIGGPRMTLAFSHEYLTWTNMYEDWGGGDEGAIAWCDVSSIVFRPGRGFFSVAEMAIRTTSGMEIVFDTMFPVHSWRSLRRGMASIHDEKLTAKVSPEAPDVLELMGGFVMLWILWFGLVLSAPFLLPWWLLVVCVATFVTYCAVSVVLDLLRPRFPPRYPRIINVANPAASLR